MGNNAHAPDNQREAHRMLGALANDLVGVAGRLAATDRVGSSVIDPHAHADALLLVCRISQLAGALFPPLQIDVDVDSNQQQQARLDSWRGAFPSWSAFHSMPRP